MKMIITLLFGLCILIVLSSITYASQPLSYFNGSFFEGFESGSFVTNDWVIYGGNHWVVDTTPYEGKHAARGNRNNGDVNGEWIRNNISTVGYEMVWLSFYYRTDGYDGVDGDYCLFEWSDDGFSNWQTLVNVTNQNVAWTNYNAALNSSASNNSQFAVRLRAYSNKNGEYCLLDNLNITGILIPISIPVISNVGSSGITYTSAIINWITNIAANATVNYGVTPNLGLTKLYTPYETSHSITLDNLFQNASYYYNVTSCNSVGCSSSGPYVFMTLAINRPVINSVNDFPDPINQTQNITITANVTAGDYPVSSVWAQINGINYTLIQYPDLIGNLKDIFVDDFNRYASNGEPIGNYWVDQPILGWSSVNNNNKCVQDGTNDCIISNVAKNIPQNITRGISTNDFMNITLNAWAQCGSHTIGQDYLQIEAYDGTGWTVIYNSNTNGGCSATPAPLPQINLASGFSDNANFKLKYGCSVSGGAKFCLLDKVNISGIQLLPNDLWNLSYNVTTLIGLQTYTVYANDTKNYKATSLSGSFIVENVPPQITYISVTNSPLDPTEDGVSYLNVLFNATDNIALDVSSALCKATYQSISRIDSFPGFNCDAENKNCQFTCNIGMQHYDYPDIWNLTLSIKNTFNNNASNQTTFMYNQLKAVQVYYAPVNFGNLTRGDGKISNNITAKNTGNVQFDFNVTGSDLLGITDPNNNISVSNLKWDVDNDPSDGMTVTKTSTPWYSGMIGSKEIPFWAYLYIPANTTLQDYTGEFLYEAH